MRPQCDRCDSVDEYNEKLIAENERLKSNMNCYCAYCTFESPVGPTSWDDLQKHVQICEFHPINKANKERDAWKSEALALLQSLDELVVHEGDCSDGNMYWDNARAVLAAFARFREGK